MAKDIPVRGDIQPATAEGFAAIIEKANEVYSDGLLLINVVALGPKALGAVFVRMPQPERESNLL